MYLDINCTLEDVIEATTEQIWYSFNNGPEGYTDEVVMEMAKQLTLRGL